MKSVSQVNTLLLYKWRDVQAHHGSHTHGPPILQNHRLVVRDGYGMEDPLVVGPPP